MPKKDMRIDISVSCNRSVVLCRSDLDVLLSHCDCRSRQTEITSDHNVILSMSAGSRFVSINMTLLKESFMVESGASSLASPIVTSRGTCGAP